MSTNTSLPSSSDYLFCRDCSPVHPIIHCSKVEQAKTDAESEDDEVEMELGREIFYMIDAQCGDGYRSALRFSPKEITVG